MENSNSHETLCFTDGSSINQHKAGASCLVTIDRKNVVLIGKYLGNKTNNYAELYAIYMLLYWMINRRKYTDKAKMISNIVVVSDSTYAINAVTGKNKANVNVEIIEKIKTLINKLRDDNVIISFKHVKSHTKNKDFESVCNDIVDKTANDCANNATNIYKLF